jgi:transcriptional regulator GlxA family with amidase domain
VGSSKARLAAVPGIELTGNGRSRAATLLAVAVIFGQAQYIVQPIPPACDGSLRDLLEWLGGHLDQPLSVRQLAARANMSERTFARRFVAEAGTTPQRWLTGQRILLAQQLLEETDETVEAIADHTGFGNATALRHHFRLWRGTTPNAYRRLFRGDPG